MQSVQRQRRIRKQFENFARNQMQGVKIVARSTEGNLLLQIEGPQNTVFNGMTYFVLFSYPEDYPSAPISVKFKSNIFHSSVTENGEVCLQVLRDYWVPSLTIDCVIAAVLSLLAQPSSEANFNPDAAFLLEQNYELFEERNKNSSSCSQAQVIKELSRRGVLWTEL